MAALTFCFVTAASQMFALCECPNSSLDPRRIVRKLSHLDVEKAGSGDVRYGRPHLLTCMNDIYTKGIDSVPSNIVTINARDQDLAFMIVHKKSSDHFATVLQLPDSDNNDPE